MLTYSLEYDACRGQAAFKRAAGHYDARRVSMLLNPRILAASIGILAAEMAGCAIRESQHAPAVPAVASNLIFPQDAYENVITGKTLLVDVRAPHERRSGSPSGVVAHITFPLNDEIAGDFVRQVLRLVNGDRSTSITLICEIGVRSTVAQRKLEENGFQNALSVVNGFQAWMDMGLPRLSPVERM